MWDLDHKESWAPKNRCFGTVVLEKTLESPLDSRRSNQWILKEISPEYSLEGLMLKLKLFGHLMRRTDSLEKTLMLGKTEGRRRRGRQRKRRLDGIIGSTDMSLSRLRELETRTDREAWRAAAMGLRGLGRGWAELDSSTCASLPGGTSGEEPACQLRRRGEHAGQNFSSSRSSASSLIRGIKAGFDPWVGKIPWRRAWPPTPVFLPGESHEQRSLPGYSPQLHRESDRTGATEHMHSTTSVYNIH